MSRRNPRDRRVKMLRLWLRGLRKMSRSEENAKRIKNTCMIMVYDGETWAKFRYSEWKFARYLSGVRRGTIL